MKRYDLKPKGEKPAVLDIGCGNTPMENGTVLMDIDETIKGKFKNKKIVYHDANLLPYPFKNNTFDYIYLNNIIEHLTVGDSLLFKELFRTLKVYGKVEIHCPNSLFNIKSYPRLLKEMITKEKGRCTRNCLSGKDFCFIVRSGS